MYSIQLWCFLFILIQEQVFDTIGVLLFILIQEYGVVSGLEDRSVFGCL